MRFAVLGLTTTAAMFALAACQNPPAPVRQDTGSMAYPTPQNAGTISTTTPGRLTPTDTGSMAFPTPQNAGNVSTTRTTGRSGAPTDTGSMAYPQNLPQGTVGRSTP